MKLFHEKNIKEIKKDHLSRNSKLTKIMKESFGGNQSLRNLLSMLQRTLYNLQN